jgi:ferric-dicitrate binding protein FerR (iron transport regulator)
LTRAVVAALLLVILLTECRWCGEKKPSVPPDWVARVVALKGDVRVAEGPNAAAAKQGDYLRVGCRLETGATGEATLDLRTGGSLKIKPNSLVEFRSTMPQLQRGEVVGMGSRVQAAELVIGVGRRKIRLPTAAEATVSTAAGGDPTVQVAFGKATIEGPEGDKQTIVAGKRLVFGSPAKPDAGPASRPDAGIVVAPEVVFYLQATGKGRVMIKRPDAKRFVLVRPGETVKITPGTRLKLAAKAKVVVGPEKGTGTTVTGPAQFTVEEGPDKTPDGKPTVRLENTGNEITVSLHGKPGKEGTPFEVDGVKVQTRITWNRLDVKVRKERTRSVLSVGAGEATLAAKNGTQRIEAGQDSIIAKGKASGPQMPPAGVMEVRTGGTMRVFAAGPSIPVTFKWNPAEGAKGSLVEVSRSAGFGNPIFSDVIQRRQLTLPQVPRGSLYWRVTPVDGSGKAGKAVQGHLVLVKDTSHRTLKDRQAPKNVIQESFGNTTVYYQNLLPRFTFRWESMGADKYQVKIYREQNITKPIFTSETKSTEMLLAAGKLGEGTYVWYVAGRNADGSLVRASKFRRLQIKYDNATPDLQIVYPPNGAVVSGGSLEAKGVTIPGSKVMINGVKAELDETYRFTHVVKLKPGVNNIIFLVVDPRRGSSYYLRQVSSP